MVDVTETMIFSQRILRYAAFEATVSTNDTVTLDDFEDISVAKAWKLKDASEVTVSVSGNVITITGAVTSERIVGFVIGV